nr:MAG: replication associated protein [Cressdnaviricota sp.]
MPAYELNAKSVFLTYSQVAPTWTTQGVLDFVVSKCATGTYICAAKEAHANGGSHFHVFIRGLSAIRSKNPRFFDKDGYHPNVQGAREWKNVLEYVKKDGQWLESGQLPQEKKDSWKALESAATKEEFFNMAKTLAPRDYILQHERLEYFANKKFKIDNKYVGRYTSFTIDTTLSDWFVGNYLMPRATDRPKSLYLVGPSRIGKTEWARSLGPHVYWNGMCNLAVWDDEATYLVIDDVPWEFVWSIKALFGAQQEFTLTDKYARKKQICNWNNPVIYLCNEDMDVYHTCKETSWLRDNCVYFKTTNKFY